MDVARPARCLMRTDYNRGMSLSHCPWIVAGLGVALAVSDAHADPTRLWSTYLGGTGGEGNSDVCFDSMVDIVSVGSAGSATGIAGNLPGYTTFDATPNGGYDAFVTKFDFFGERLWGTYYGGPEWDDLVSLAIDPSDKVVAFGTTFSGIDVATLGDISLGGLSDGMLVKFDPDGTRAWARYFGGDGFESGEGVCVASTGTIYIVGSTTSAAGLSSGAVHQTSREGATDAFIAKVTSGGALVWASYFGGVQGDTIALDCVVDADQNIFVVGSTTSSGGISKNGWDNVYSAGTDAFLAKFSTNGAHLRGTYYGGSGNDVARAVALDDEGNVYIAGETSSANGANIIATDGTTLASTGDAFVAQFDAESLFRGWGTYFGGVGLPNYTHYDSFEDMEVSAGTIKLSGRTNSVNGIATPDALKTSHSGGLDGTFVSMLADDGTVTYATYIGAVGDGAETGSGVAATFDHAVVTGQVAGTGLATAGASDTTYGGALDGYLMLFRLFAM